ncbi:MAG TPA: hypothetical protein VGP93_16360, partial [Polyangiaceae bacterium]|nr:hypothetical protein [Polyangiaceae bacterium]
MKRSSDALVALGLPAADGGTPQPGRFADGAELRLEIPSTEGMRALSAALEEADRIGCPVHRFSQGSGVQMLSDGELKEIAALCAERGVEYCVFVTPRANFDTGALWSAPAGKAIQWQVRGADQLRYALDDVFRAVDLGLRSILVSDFGL